MLASSARLTGEGAHTHRETIDTASYSSGQDKRASRYTA